MAERDTGCETGHRGPFSFGCMPGVLRCDACGKRVTEQQAMLGFRLAALDVEAEIEKVTGHGRS